ncbi:MAG: hypothetical protein VB934_06515 [Polyangiaceae bacterium]
MNGYITRGALFLLLLNGCGSSTIVYTEARTEQPDREQRPPADVRPTTVPTRACELELVDLTVEHVDDAWLNGVSLAVDGDGELHVAYAVGTDLRYARRADGVWWIDAEAPVQESGEAPSLAIDVFGRRHVSYYRSNFSGSTGPGVLRYVVAEQSLWSDFETVEPNGSLKSGLFNDIVVTAGGDVHVVYYQLHTKKLRHAWRDAAGWSTETIASEGGRLSLAIDTADALHVAYTSQNRLHYATKPVNGAWSDTVVLDSDDDVERPQIAVGPDSVHIAFTHDPTGQDELFHAWRAKGSWNVEAAGLPHGRNPQITVEEGRVHVVAQSYGGLTYAVRTSNGWHHFPLDTSEPAGLRSSILWHDQMIHVLYAANGTLRYARFSPSCGG